MAKPVYTVFCDQCYSFCREHRAQRAERRLAMLRYMLLLLALIAVPVALACQVIATKLPLLLATRAAVLGH